MKHQGASANPPDFLPPVHDFRPLPFLGNRHLQTLLGNMLRGLPFHYPTRERQVGLPDGDRVVLHDSIPTGWLRGGPIALLLHGLGGSHRSFPLQRLAGLLLPRGVRVVRMDLRGCGRGIALSRRSYHGGCSPDVRAALAELHRWSPTSPLLLAGFSLGGNIALKLAGEAPDEPVAGLTRVAALAPPIDLIRCAALLSLPHNRIYERHFVRELIRQVRRRQRLMPDLPPVRFPRRMTMRLFDDLHTAPTWGFADALDYYRRASSRPVLKRIRVPTLILTARDDPFIAVESYEGVALAEQVELRILERGGHLGFLGWDGVGGIRWAERRLADWMVADG
jgi:predicted alpha/beta-fold hydrolase